jgi:cytochrome P450 PksS
METRIAIPALLQRFDRLELTVPAAKLRWRPHIGLRGVEALPLSVTATGAAVGRSAH